MTLKNLFGIIAIVCCANLHAQPVLHPFELKGTIQGIDTGVLVLRYYSYPEQKRDTILVRAGHFLCQGMIAEPTSAELYTINKTFDVSMFISPNRMELAASIDQPSSVLLSGSVMQDDYLAFEKTNAALIASIKKAYAERQRLNALLSEEPGPAKKAVLQQSADLVGDTLDQLNRQNDLARKQYIVSHPGSFYALSLFYMLSGNEEIPPAKAINIFEQMEDSIKSSFLGTLVATNLLKQQQSYPGAKAYLFKAKDMHQHLFDLESLSGKVILLDFWASWCVPCRASTPFLRSLYQEFHHEGFDIVSISQDDDEAAWRKAVAEDNMVWQQVSMPSMTQRTVDTKHDITDHYYVQAIPVYILVDRSGKIVGRWKGWSTGIRNELHTAIQKQLNR